LVNAGIGNKTGMTPFPFNTIYPHATPSICFYFVKMKYIILIGFTTSIIANRKINKTRPLKEKIPLSPPFFLFELLQ
jgi:hypothetical protein